MKKQFISAAIILAVFFAACSNDGTNKETTSPETEQVSNDNNTAAPPSENVSAEALPGFTIKDISGNNINLQSFKGKKVFVNLWASWCPPCRQEMPSIEKLSKQVDKANVAFVMLSLDENFERAKDFAKQQQLALPIYHPAENLPALFDVQSIPTTFIFDESGRLIQRIDGGDNYDSEKYRMLLQ